MNARARKQIFSYISYVLALTRPSSLRYRAESRNSCRVREFANLIIDNPQLPKIRETSRCIFYRYTTDVCAAEHFAVISQVRQLFQNISGAKGFRR